jgi:hypothetical protein
MSKENEGGKRQKMSRKAYERQLAKLEIELHQRQDIGENKHADISQFNLIIEFYA